MTRIFGIIGLLGLCQPGLGVAQAVAPSVTLFGIVDMGVFDNRVKTNGLRRTRLGLQSGGETASRWGLRGAEDLGDGYRATFLLENGFSMTDGVLMNNARLFGRQSWLGLSGSFGEVRFGRQLIASADYFATTASPFGGSFSQASIGNGGFRAAALPRFDNQVKYIAPKWHGFQLAGSYAFNTRGDNGSSSNNVRALSLVMQYQAQEWTVTGSYDQVRPSAMDIQAQGRKPVALQLGGNYVAGPATFYLAWSRQKEGWIKSAEGAATGTNSMGEAGYFNGYVDAMLVGAKITQAANTYYLAYHRVRPHVDSFERSVAVYNLGYIYRLSTRTNLYALASVIDGDLYGFTPNSYSRQVGVGLRHNF